MTADPEQLPPVIAEYRGPHAPLGLHDGTHRHEALRRHGATNTWALIWCNTESDFYVAQPVYATSSKSAPKHDGDSMFDVRYAEGYAVDDFLALARRVWPRDHSRDDAADALTRTVNVGAWDGDRLVGSVRILTDGYFFATIPEILVDPDYQRRGIGRRHIELALERAPRGKLWFGAQPQSVEFFERIGCRTALTGFVAERRGAR